MKRHRPSSRNKKNLKQLNLPSKGIRERRTKKAQSQQNIGNTKDQRGKKEIKQRWGKKES